MQDSPENTEKDLYAYGIYYTKINYCYTYCFSFLNGPVLKKEFMYNFSSK